MSKENTINKKIINPIITRYTGIHSHRSSSAKAFKSYTRINWFYVLGTYEIGMRICLKRIK